MITAKDLIASNNRLISKCESEIGKIERGSFQYDGTLPKTCVKPMYETKIARMVAANEYLKDLGEEHTLTDDELYMYRLIVNGTPDLL